MAAVMKLNLLRGVVNSTKIFSACCSTSTNRSNSTNRLPQTFDGPHQFYRPLLPKPELPDERDFLLELLLFMHQDIDFSYAGLKKWQAKKLKEAIVYDQRYIEERFNILGPDLAAAHFLVHRGGGVKFVGIDKWIRRDAQKKYTLPRKYIPNLFLEAIDVSGVPIIYNGLINLEKLEQLRYISFRECSQVDDFFMDWLTVYKDQLLQLDISGCSKVTERGVSSLVRLRKLQQLNLNNLVRLKHPELVCLLIEDELPDCKIVGIDYMNTDILCLPEKESVVTIEGTPAPKLVE